MMKGAARLPHPLAGKGWGEGSAALALTRSLRDSTPPVSQER
jgi:hypothetical protein